MPRVDRFGRGVAFAALAGLAAIGGPLGLSGLMGARAAVGLCFALFALAWLYGIADRPATGLRAVLVAGPIALGWVAVAPSATVAAVGLTVLIAVARGVFLAPRAPGRAVLVEGAVGLGALALASAFVPGGLLGLGLAVWAYFLVQSLALLPGGAAPARHKGADAFADAIARAERLLGR